MKITRRVLSPAKVNLGLWLLGKRADGYHEIETVFHAVSLCDEIYISEGRFSVETSTGIPQEDNLVFKALVEFQRRIGRDIDFSIYIEKKIPAGSGLGGGSSNVATVLKEINQLMGEPLSMEELVEIGGSVSSDAPFFFTGGTAVGRGRGDVIEPIDSLELDITIVTPSVRCSTREIYSAVSSRDFKKPDMGLILEGLRSGEYGLLENRLGEIACELYPEVGEVVRFIESLGYKALVSGSGSAVFYIGRSVPQLQKGVELRGWRVFEVKSWLGV